MALIYALATALMATEACAQTTFRIVALGASNTAGKGRGATNMGVPPAQAYPAQLQQLLRARGYNAQITNAGIAGDTTADMLTRLERAVPAGDSSHGR